MRVLSFAARSKGNAQYLFERCDEQTILLMLAHKIAVSIYWI